MFKIQKSANGGNVIFVLSGRMDGESTAELENLIRKETKDQQMILDIGDLTLVSPSDIDFLARCEAGGIKLVKGARYIREWIARNRARSKGKNPLTKEPARTDLRKERKRWPPQV